MLLLGLLAVVLASVTAFVLTSNTISERKKQVAVAQAQLAAAQAQAGQLTRYQQYEGLAHARAQTVIQIATSRFEWHAALSDLSKVVPPNTSLQSLVGTVSPDVNVSSGGGATGTAVSGSTLRSDINAPAFELNGCTKSQDDVARLMSRLRVINGVTRVTLASSQKQGGVGSGSGPAGGPAQGCGGDSPTFDVVVFFKPLPGAGTSSATTPTASAAGTSGTSTSQTSTTASTTTSTTGASPSTTASPQTSSSPAGTRPAATTSGANR